MKLYHNNQNPDIYKAGIWERYAFKKAELVFNLNLTKIKAILIFQIWSFQMRMIRIEKTQ
jgi:hypothetical protein